MIKHYLITAFRNISRNFGYSLINFIGLSIGITLFILIMLFVSNEYSYDKFNENYDRIYRFEFGDAESLHLPSAAGLDAQDWFPEIEKVVRFKAWGAPIFKLETKTFKIQDVMLADSSFFDVFTAEFVKGDSKTAFKAANSIILTEKNAKIIFGNEDPINQILKKGENEFVVTGVIKDFQNFHLQIGALIPFNILAYLNDLNKIDREFLRSYGTWQFPTYFLLPTSFDEKILAEKLVTKFLERWPDWEDPLITLRPLKDVYFAPDTHWGAIKGNKNNVKLFLAIGIFIIFIACINFINLTTAKASSRATEVGIRKVHGSFRRQLIFQFLSESILISSISFFIAISLVQILLPFFNNFIQKDISFLSVLNLNSVSISIIGILLIGIIAGTYPAFYLTAFNPIKVLKGEKTKGKSAIIFRRILIVIQFTISVALIISTITVHKQLKYLRLKDMGFDKENTVAIRLNNTIQKEKESFKQTLLNYPEIESIAFSAGIIGSMGNTESFDFNSDGERTSIQLHSIDPTFIELYDIEILEGRNFSFDHVSDAKRNIILNEEAVKAAGLKLGKTAGTIFHRDEWYFTALPSKECEIIGVVKNFNYRSLHNPIGAQGLAWNDDWHYTVNIKIKEGSTDRTLEIIEKTFNEFSDGVPFEYRFVDDHIDSLYKSEKKLGKFFTYFAIIAIMIAMLGLFGLAAFIAESRTKEIGIRKALGSSITKIIYIITKEFIKWVVVANFIAIPIAYYGMNKWLQSFAFRTKISIDIFIVSLIISLVIALVTVFYQSIKAARSNPADSLRYE